MVGGPRILAAAFFLVFLGELLGGAFPAPRSGTEEELLARIQRERDPVKKARYEVRLARVKLLQAIDAYDAGDHEQCLERLGVYLERVKSAWETLRTASRKQKGFREMDIALRQDGRLIEDLRRRVPDEDRDAVEKVGRAVEDIRTELLKALFPADRPEAAGNNFVRRDDAGFSTGGVLR